MIKLTPANLASKLVGFKRSTKLNILVITDSALLIFSVWGAYSLRFEDFFVPNFSQAILMLAAPLLAIPVFLKTGLYRPMIRYLGEQALWSLIMGVSLSALIWSSFAFMTQMTGAEGVPRSIPVLYWLIGLLLLVCSRFTTRQLLRMLLRSSSARRPVLIYGAGVAGRQLLASLRRGGDIIPIGFLDEDTAIHGKDVDGLRVYAPNQLDELIKRFDIHDAIVTLQSTANIRWREMVTNLKQRSLQVRILPAMNDIVSGKHLVNLMREVEISDLLGRDPVVADRRLLKQCIADKAVAVTGAGGSIGSELCLQIAAIGPKQIILIETSELALYQIDRTVRSVFDGEVVSCLGSVQDASLMTQLLVKHKVQTLYHTAAYKHVPLVEINVMEGVRNNVLGTLTLAQAAFTAGVETFLLISTDKAVRPTSVMGATKRWAEWVVQEFSRRSVDSKSGQKFCAVRFGNVLVSSGSVIPLFKEQIEQGGPVKVTHTEVTRYFMSIHEAVELVIQAGSLTNGGEIFLLDMGTPVKIMDLARNMIGLAGYTVRDEANQDGEIEIVITSLRPGEKLFEELLSDDNSAEGTSHPRITKFCKEDPSIEFEQLISKLKDAVDADDENHVYDILMKASMG